jgi:uncharacterized protein YecE (DUF72 family)
VAQAFIGTSGYDYPEWRPGFYPADLPRKQFLQYYASRFRSVELNNTFYQMPNPARIAAWLAATPGHFRIVLKAHRRITHVERLKLPSDALRYFLQSASGLQQRLGALLFQLPPFFECDIPKLSAFLGALPRDLPSAFEFRHDSWFTDETYAILEANGAALCVNDADDKTTPVRLTSRFAYLRLRKSQYAEGQRREWQERIRSWVGQGIDVFAFIKHEDNPEAPLVALQFDAFSGSPFSVQG